MNDEVVWEVWCFENGIWWNYSEYTQTISKTGIDLGYEKAKKEADDFSKHGCPVRIVEATTHRRVAYEDLRGEIL